MKFSASTVLSILLCVVLVIGAVCIGAVRGWSGERQELLAACSARHTVEATELRQTVQDCRKDMADFDRRLNSELTGRIAMLFGVTPIADSVDALHEQLLEKARDPLFSFDLKEGISKLAANTVGLSFSFFKVILAVVALVLLFGTGLVAKVLAAIGIISSGKARNGWR